MGESAPFYRLQSVIAGIGPQARMAFTPESGCARYELGRSKTAGDIVGRRRAVACGARPRACHFEIYRVLICDKGDDDAERRLALSRRLAGAGSAKMRAIFRKW